MNIVLGTKVMITLLSNEKRAEESFKYNENCPQAVF